MLVQKIIQFFSPYMGRVEAEALGIQIDGLVRKVTEDKVGLEPLAEFGHILFEVVERLKREMMIKKITELHFDLNRTLTEYVNVDTASKIEQNATDYLLKALNTGQAYFDIEQAFGKIIQKELLSVPNKKKSVDAVHYEFQRIFREYERSIDQIFDKVKSNVYEVMMSVLTNSLSQEELNRMGDQTKSINTWQNEAIQYVESKIEQTKEWFESNSIILDQRMKEVVSRLLSEGRSRGEVQLLASEECKPLQEEMKQSIDREIEKLITEWCAVQPPEISNAINRDLIKSQLKLGLTLDWATKIITNTNEAHLSLLAPISDLHPRKLKNIQERLRVFLSVALTPQLISILSETSVDLDVDGSLRDAVVDFRLLMHRLPDYVQELFKSNLSIEDKQKRIQELDLTAWVPSSWIMNQLNSARDLLIRVNTYAELYLTHLSKLALEESEANEKKLAEELLELSTDKVNLEFVRVLEMSINKNNNSMFNLFLNKANQGTLKEVYRRVTESSYKPTNSELFHQFLTSLEDKLAKFQITPVLHEQNEDSEVAVSSFRPS